ncbi:DUF3987 domain-containing protein [Geomonas propionica]|uniref:DUF3987 domain-containing protein n=1 Tax=Geomonas propionica TaxID=2798582 RepID=A0ABS0YPD3_9BACT|nr:DUF3987 domain-containing protein [Geomonas propionica]MBJ6799327.1 DUF3987 domain-containing protein [Geomonas propionica]
MNTCTPLPITLPPHIIQLKSQRPELFSIDDFIAGIASFSQKPDHTLSTTMSRTLRTAQELVKRGISIIPLEPRGKKPRIRWTDFQSRLATQEELTHWFADGRNNIGIVTGKISGLVVVDFDTNEAIEMAKIKNFPKTALVKTGRGYHAYCRYREGVRNFQKRDDLPGIDLRGDGGFVVAPPSIHASGAVYTWVPNRSIGDLPLADLPGWIYASKPADKAAITDLLKGVSEGGRNNAVTRVAGSVISKGYNLAEAIRFCLTWNTTSCKPPLTEDEVTITVKSIYAAHIRNNGERTAIREPITWNEPPSPLPDGLPPVKALDPANIPVPLQGWLVDIADRMQIPPDFSAAAAVVALGSIIGRGCGIQPKRHDDWLVVPNIWGAVVGRPSLMKTPAISEAQRHLVRLEAEARETYQDAARSFEIQSEIIKITRNTIMEEIKKAVKAKSNDAIEAARQKLAALESQVPKRRRYQTQDGTTEKIGELLNENPNGLLVNRDELIGWFRSLDKNGREGDRSFYLEAWNGNRPFTYDRIGRGTLDIPALCVSVFGAITPGPLSDYVYQANRGGMGDDGLLQRFQVFVWPDAPSAWKNVDRFPDTKEKDRAREIFKRLARGIPGIDTKEEGSIPSLHFSPGGQEVFDKWRLALETRLRGDHGLHPAMESHLAKYRKLMPSLALIFHLVAVADGEMQGPVSEVSAVLAVRWCEYLESHAMRIYGAATPPGMDAAREIVKHIKRGAIKDGAKIREIWRPQWSRLTTSDQVKAGLDVLCQYDWLAVEKSCTSEHGGRPSEIIRINPLIKAG